MSLPAFKNFLFVPHNSQTSAGFLYELETTAAYCENGFVLIPYQNPRIKSVTPVFFKIKRVSDIDLSQHLQNSSAQEIVLKENISKADYIKEVSTLKEHIQKGNIYEINYCIRFSAESYEIDPVAVFDRLHKLAKAPYAALLKYNHDFILCASPELFLKKEGTTISTKPIKGTIRRGRDANEDPELKNELQNSLKERTENVMAVDVARNDLSMFAQKGSVRVNKLYNIETFETVHQMVSTVSCEIKEHILFKDILCATFPMASMTGAPKQSAMDLIDTHETFDRHFYSGSMGIIDEKGDYTLSVLIRSIFYNTMTKELSIAVGGAITYLSDPEKEYEECLLKANGMLKALNARLNH